MLKKTLEISIPNGFGGAPWAQKIVNEIPLGTLGCPWGALGLPLGALGRPLDALGRPLGALWAPFGRPWGALWAPLGFILEGGGMLAEPFKSAAQGLKP